MSSLNVYEHVLGKKMLTGVPYNESTVNAIDEFREPHKSGRYWG